MSGTLTHAGHYGLISIALLVLLGGGWARLRRGWSADGAPGAGTPDQDGPAGQELGRVVVPVALVSSAAAAGVHAAMAVPHFREGLLLGMFFVLAATLQLTWAVLLVAQRGRRLLVAGVLVNGALLTVWALTRTVGLPLRLVTEPEAIGAWDLACGAWELVVMVSCCLLLRGSSSLPHHVASWRKWHRSVRAYSGGSIVTLAALVVSGAG